MLILIKYGNIIISSTSKITKTKATKKKWSLNFSRKLLKVLKPHSKGLWSSRSTPDFLETALPKIRKRVANKKEDTKIEQKK